MTGWLGWPPDTVLDTPMGLLHLALEGKFEFLRKTNPWRSQEDIDAEQRAEEMAEVASRGPDEEGMAAVFASLVSVAKPFPKRSAPIVDG